MSGNRLLPFEISPSVSGMVVHFQEGDGEDFLEFNSWNAETNTHERIKVTIRGLVGLKYDDLDIWREPSIGIIEDSEWLRRKSNRQEERHPEHGEMYRDKKHLYFSGHDMCVQVIADSIDYKSLGNLSW